MEWLLILALGVAVFRLWGRVQSLEQRLGAMEEPAAPARSMAVSYRRTSPWGEAQASAPPASPPIVTEQPDTEAEVELSHTDEDQPLPPEPVADAEVEPYREPVEQLFTDDRIHEAEPEPAPARTPLDLEDLFGRVLPIWAGGLTLAVAGFFVVRFSIEAGLLTPMVRVVLGFLFGLGLIGGAEAAYRAEHRIADPRVRQALAGAGIATLYAAFYLAGTLYGLIGPAAAFAGLAAVTAAAIGLSHRFGVPSAVLGLVGGFAAPLLVPSDGANVPLLATYLALLTGGLMGSARARRWSWLGVGALAGGLMWGFALLLGGTGLPADLLATGGFIALVGALLPALLTPLEGRWRQAVEMAAAAIAALQMGVLVMRADFTLHSWGLLVLLAGALVVLGWRNPALRRVSAFGSLLLPALLLDWDNPTLPALAWITAVLAAIFAGVPLALVWLRRHGTQDTAQLLAAPLGLAAAFAAQANGLLAEPDRAVAAAALLLAPFPMLGCWRLWPERGEIMGLGALALGAGAALLTFAGIGVLLPPWALTLLAAALTGGWLLLARGRSDEGMLTLAWAGAAACAALLAVFADPAEFARLAGVGEYASAPLAALRWLGSAALLAGLALVEHRRSPALLAEAAAALFAYGAGAQLLPADALAWFAALGALALLAARREAGPQALGGVALLWAGAPLLEWLVPATLSLTGEPMLLSDVPAPCDLLLRVLPVLAVLGGALARHIVPAEASKPLAIAAGSLALVVLHSGYKHLFAVGDAAAFAARGLAERTVWEGLLLALAAAAWRLRGRAAWARPLALGLGGAAFAHWLAHTLLLHNPLWSAQAVGALPVLNMLLPAYAVGLGALIWAKRNVPAIQAAGARPLLDTGVMALIALLAFSELRQLFSGTFLLATPVGQSESLLRSLTGIALAAGFLWWGARRRERSWRIGSLAAALLTVGKVFLVDAAGLDGFGRIASFAALGFSLIGIGWFYSRQLRR